MIARNRAAAVIAAVLVLLGVAAASERHANGSIAYLYRGGIYTVRPDGTHVRRLAGGDRHGTIYYEVAWSPDGRRLAAFDMSGLYVLDAAGGAPRKLLDGDSTGAVFLDVVWSPRGDELAVVSGPPEEIELVRVADGSVRKLVDGTFPSWTPDGEAVVYQRTGRSLPGDPDTVWMIRRDGTGDHELAADARMPFLSPDGRRIAFVSESLRGDLLVMSADGLHRRTLARGSLARDVGWLDPSWSPDGRFVLARRDVGSHSRTTCCAESLYFVPASGGKLRLVRRGVDAAPGAWQPVSR